ncbi:hypothetical protein FT663_01933 [Candidozyma haemuli var. vulneris]|uniref:RRM domain-containing protein n=1 Tax=Candidozyma haemuli TaxID=45357 RepID=A0A2V1AX39_9ASCO|nr:hypothetical protein CXQ85_000408 [[Candida] haemuloni]KAF3987279.1 hypothetical protein FT662_04070 [[Candida] haemuloni var. vulneris]KAF3993343.1 hypothetical protein FT663_01933 [[Candida] haemuloni var. vulneris]PVH21431.1 hypothetical protein CXQ85_000408 [[Candida] haemuloni]
MSDRKRANGGEASSTKRSRSEVQQTLYIKNLNDKIPKHTIKHTLYLLFSTYGDVLEISMPKKMRGQAHVVLDCKQSANNALRGLQKTSVFGKELHIDYAKSKTKLVENIERQIEEET